MMDELAELQAELRAARDPQRALKSQQYFKTGPQEYAEGDKFLGVPVPEQRRIARKHRRMPLEEVVHALRSPWHEERLTAVFIMVDQYQRGDDYIRSRLYETYVTNLVFINNWDLVDSSAPYIVGPQLDSSPYKMQVLEKLARSESVWERRIAMLSTFYYIHKQARAEEALAVATLLLHDRHELVNKAVGWMLREIGKRVDMAVLERFLSEYGATMSRTTLRYAIERLTPERRRFYLTRNTVQ